MFQAKGMPAGALPELYNINNKETVAQIHRAYLESGCDIIKTNTFGANPLKLCDEGITVCEVVKNAVSVARAEADAFGKWVALDIGPTGKLLAPMGTLPFEKAVEAFKETVRAGKDYCDLILIETMSDIYEAKAALLAAKEESELPVFVTLSFDERGRLLTGADIKTAVGVLEGLGADAIGLNCGLGPAQMLKLVREFSEYSSLPIIANPNAGLPVSENGKTVFKVEPEEFAEDMKKMIELGVCVAGGCCGTTPAHIKRTVELCRNFPVKMPGPKSHTYITSYSHAVDISSDYPVIIGERINPTGKKRLKQALIEKDISYILNEAVSQIDAGAHILDVNAGLNEINQPEMMETLIYEIQSVTDTPLQIDSSDIETLERGMRIYNGKPMINSVNGKEESMKAVFPLIKKYGGVVVALCLDDDGIPETAEGRIRIAEKILSRAKEYGIDKKDIVFDPLALTVSTGAENGNVTLEALRGIRDNLGSGTVLGVSNISFGLPSREKINSTFYAMALLNGLSAGIVNPLSEAMTDTYYSYLALTGKDENCTLYTEKYALAAKQETTNAAASHSLSDCILKGLKEESSSATEILLKEKAPLEIINEYLVPALDEAGKRFEEKKLFLPQLLMSAEAAKSAFSVIKNYMADNGLAGESKGKILLATVKGDIHDIGKNIVRVLLENYGYEVIDLGKDVSHEKILEETQKSGIKLVGLSALMTTTVDSMEEAIKLLKANCNCLIMVGGAVLTKEYAERIGADFYAKDAMEAVRYANKIFQ